MSSPLRIEKLLQVISQRQPDLTIILENVKDLHNISAVMRTCDAVGIPEIYVLNNRIPKHDYFGPRSSSSACKWVNVNQFDDLDACVEAVRSRYDYVFTTQLSDKAVSLYDIDLTRKTALVFGNERTGCSNEIIAKADGNFMIPQVGIIQSLNISVACAVSVYEAFRQKKAAGHFEQQKLGGEDLQKVYRDWKMFDFVNRE